MSIYNRKWSTKSVTQEDIERNMPQKPTPKASGWNSITQEAIERNMPQKPTPKASGWNSITQEAIERNMSQQPTPKASGWNSITQEAIERNMSQQPTLKTSGWNSITQKAVECSMPKNNNVIKTFEDQRDIDNSTDATRSNNILSTLANIAINTANLVKDKIINTQIWSNIKNKFYNDSKDDTGEKGTKEVDQYITSGNNHNITQPSTNSSTFDSKDDTGEKGTKEVDQHITSGNNHNITQPSTNSSTFDSKDDTGEKGTKEVDQHITSGNNHNITQPSTNSSTSKNIANPLKDGINNSSTFINQMIAPVLSNIKNKIYAEKGIKEADKEPIQEIKYSLDNSNCFPICEAAENNSTCGLYSQNMENGFNFDIYTKSDLDKMGYNSSIYHTD